jgi:hypothetical protein
MKKQRLGSRNSAHVDSEEERRGEKSRAAVGVLLSVLYSTYGVRASGSFDLEESHTVSVITKRGKKKKEKGVGGRTGEEGGVMDRHEG